MMPLLSMTHRCESISDLYFEGVECNLPLRFHFFHRVNLFSYSSSEAKNICRKKVVIADVILQPYYVMLGYKFIQIRKLVVH